MNIGDKVYNQRNDYVGRIVSADSYNIMVKGDTINWIISRAAFEHGTFTIEDFFVSYVRKVLEG